MTEEEIKAAVADGRLVLRETFMYLEPGSHEFTKPTWLVAADVQLQGADGSGPNGEKGADGWAIIDCYDWADWEAREAVT